MRNFVDPVESRFERVLVFDSTLPLDVLDGHNIDLLKREHIDDIIVLCLHHNRLDVGDMWADLFDFCVFGGIQQKDPVRVGGHEGVGMSVDEQFDVHFVVAQCEHQFFVA